MIRLSVGDLVYLGQKHFSREKKGHGSRGERLARGHGLLSQPLSSYSWVAGPEHWALCAYKGDVYQEMLSLPLDTMASYTTDSGPEPQVSILNLIAVAEPLPGRVLHLQVLKETLNVEGIQAFVDKAHRQVLVSLRCS